MFDGTHRTKAQFIITVKPKEETGFLPGIIPLTDTQLVVVLAILLLVVVVMWALVRYRRGRSSDEEHRSGVREHGGEVA